MKTAKKKKRMPEQTIYGTIAFLSFVGFIWAVVLMIVGVFFHGPEYPFDIVLGKLLGILILNIVPLVVARKYLNWPWYVLLLLLIMFTTIIFVVSSPDIFFKKKESFDSTGYSYRKLGDLEQSTNEIVSILTQVKDSDSARSMASKLEERLSVFGGVLRSCTNVSDLSEEAKSQYLPALRKQLKSSSIRLRNAAEKAKKLATDQQEFNVILQNYLRIITDMERGENGVR